MLPSSLQAAESRVQAVPHFVRSHPTRSSSCSPPWRRGWHLTTEVAGVWESWKGAPRLTEGGLLSPLPPHPVPALPTLLQDLPLPEVLFLDSVLFFLPEIPFPDSVSIVCPKGCFASSDLDLRIHHFSRAAEILVAEADRQTSQWTNSCALRFGNEALSEMEASLRCSCLVTRSQSCPGLAGGQSGWWKRTWCWEAAVSRAAEVGQLVCPRN